MEDIFEEKLQHTKEQGHDIGVCVRIRLGNIFLLLRRSSTDAYSGIYEMPGGSVDEGEDIKTAAAREVFEETGISIVLDELKPLGVFDFHNIETNKHKSKFAFSYTLSGTPVIQLSDDHDEFHFFTPEEIEQLPRQGRDAEYVVWEDHYKILSL